MAFAPDAAVSGRFFVNFTSLAGDIVVARFRRSTNPFLADPASQFNLRWAARAAPTSSRIRSGTTTEATSPSGRTGCCTSGSATAAAATIPIIARRTRRSCSGRCCGSMSMFPMAIRSGYRIPPDNPFLGVSRTRPEIWSFGLRNPWRYSFDDPSAEERARSSSATSARSLGGDRLRAAESWRPQLRVAQPRGGALHMAEPRPAYTPLVDPIHEYDRDRGQAITGGYVYRGARWDSAIGAVTSTPISSRAACGLCESTVDSACGPACAFDIRDHTAELGGTAVLGNVSSFGLDADGELYIVSYGLGVVLKVSPVGLGVTIVGWLFRRGRKMDMTVFVLDRRVVGPECPS